MPDQVVLQGTISAHGLVITCVGQASGSSLWLICARGDTRGPRTIWNSMDLLANYSPASLPQAVLIRHGCVIFLLRKDETRCRDQCRGPLELHASPWLNIS